MYGAVSIGVRQHSRGKYPCIAGFIRLNFPSEWLIKTVYGHPSNNTPDPKFVACTRHTHKK